MEVVPRFSVSTGKPLPLGAEIMGDGVNFAVFSQNATAVTLLLFENPEDNEAFFEYALSPEKNQTGDIWHAHIHGLKAGALYLFKVDGPYLPEQGHRFNINKALIDPYTKALTGDFLWNTAEALGYDPKSPNSDLSFNFCADAAKMPKCIVVDNNAFDWQEDRPLNYPLRNTVIYETHVRGLSMKMPGAQYPGTYRGVVEAIPYLKNLGITSVEFLPLHEFDEFENTHKNPKTAEKLTNYWGYSTIAFFSPKANYSSSGKRGQQVDEFKEMVRELHKAGLEIILDIVFNHTAEGNEKGPTLSFRGLDNSIYYLLSDNKRYYQNYSGCGNTLNCNHPAVRSLIIDCLRYWVIEMHVDGFRFDLGSILGRDQNGKLMENPPILERIAFDPVLRRTKIIAEAWDAGGAYQVGGFPGGRWAEWNDRYRDDIRRFWRGDDNAIQGLATRITGSSDLYKHTGRKPFHSINFITSHDGFTLNDLVSFNGKHNEDNGEKNKDGNDSNFSYNYGYEGRVSNPVIEGIRNRQIKNFLATLLFSLGTPMLLGGDEFRRTQRGNNNAYCQNNDISWYDWELTQKHSDILRFAQQLIAFRKRHPVFLRSEFYTGEDRDLDDYPDIVWFDELGESPDWEKQQGALACRIDGSKAETRADYDDFDYYLIFNARTEPVSFSLPPAATNGVWLRLIDTIRESPEDILAEECAAPLQDNAVYTAGPRTFVLLISKNA
jgi:glycogen operon protein